MQRTVNPFRWFWCTYNLQQLEDLFVVTATYLMVDTMQLTNAMMDWVKAEGGRLSPSVVIEEIEGYGKGLRATAAMSAGEEITAVPGKECVSHTICDAT